MNDAQKSARRSPVRASKPLTTLALACAAFVLPGGPAAAAGAARSPATVGELLDHGGKQLTGPEIAKLFVGATIGGPALGQPSARFEVTYRRNGTATGEISSSGGSTKLTGTWTTNPQNQYCQDLHTAQGMPIPGCFYYFTIGNRLFMASGNDRSAAVDERRVTR